MKSKKRSVGLAERLAASPEAKQFTGGAKCSTCTFERRAEVEAECKAWNELRLNGTTSAPWSLLHAELRRELGYPARSWKTLLRHLEGCLGWTWVK